MRDYDFCKTYKIYVRYYHNGKWKRVSDVYDGCYDLDEAIEACKRNFSFYFEHRKAEIVAVYKEGRNQWVEVDW